ncbi:MAG: hypothetical protein VX278_23435 [Myxococcota bacterium]|nr:hypothetical protein [Myxococcota bacterium]
MKYFPFVFFCGCFADTSIKQYNDNPEVQIVSHEDAVVLEAGTEIFFRALLSDLNHEMDTLTAKWLLDNEVVCPESTPDAAGESVCLTTVALDNTKIQVEVRDPEGGFAVDSIQFTVESNSPPTTPDVVIAPNPAKSNESLTLQISGASDPDGDDIQYRYVWYRDGVEHSDAEGIDASQTRKGEVWRAVVYAFDGELESEPAEDSVTIVNGAPFIQSVSIESADGLYNTSEVNCVADIVEYDGDAWTANYAWYINGDLAGEEESLVLSPQLASPNDSLSCTVIATDEDGESMSLSAAEVLLNRLPTLTGLTLAPNAPATNQDLQVVYVLSDDDWDNTALSILWSVDGSTVQTGGDTLSHSFYARDQVVSVELTPSDPHEPGVAQTLSTTILNTPPQGAVLRIDPENPREGVDDLHCLLETEPSDVDGDAISHSFSWTQNGTAYTGTTLNVDQTGDGIPGSATANGDIWECSYTASDPDVSANPVTTDIEIGPDVCYAYVSNSHEVSSCTVYETQTQESCVPASGVTACYPQYCDTGETSSPSHNADGSSTGAYCSDWGQCEGSYIDVSGQSGWDWVAGYWDCTYTDVTVAVTVYGGGNCGYYYTCDLQEASCGTPDACTP